VQSDNVRTCLTPLWYCTAALGRPCNASHHPLRRLALSLDLAVCRARAYTGAGSPGAPAAPRSPLHHDQLTGWRRGRRQSIHRPPLRSVTDGAGSPSAWLVGAGDGGGGRHRPRSARRCGCSPGCRCGSGGMEDRGGRHPAVFVASLPRRPRRGGSRHWRAPRWQSPTAASLPCWRPCSSPAALHLLAFLPLVASPLPPASQTRGVPLRGGRHLATLVNGHWRAASPARPSVVGGGAAPRPPASWRPRRS